MKLLLIQHVYPKKKLLKKETNKLLVYPKNHTIYIEKKKERTITVKSCISLLFDRCFTISYLEPKYTQPNIKLAYKLVIHFFCQTLKFFFFFGK
jgi:hypothetical protein